MKVFFLPGPSEEAVTILLQQFFFFFCSTSLFFFPLLVFLFPFFIFPSTNELAEKAGNNLVTYPQQEGNGTEDKLDAFIQSTLAAHGHSIYNRRCALFRLCSCCD
ncbi:hypothetical protein CEXT_77321 [Caerostris extrusa]|uniref:Uncharacterized protein n=1 Tax=Caerostris extrusa TaxID=172846 RepID=A0AAV4UAJ2_CAEEX|nr:hypothetical protein CEXT_77321 [Caerostris extrusa]